MKKFIKITNLITIVVIFTIINIILDPVYMVVRIIIMLIDRYFTMKYLEHFYIYYFNISMKVLNLL